MSGFTRARPWHDSLAGYALRAEHTPSR